MSDELQGLIDELFHRAAERKLTFCTAESCSAGTLATAFAKGEGASTQFIGGIVAYSKEAKISLLDVPAGLLAEQTAVCAPVAEAMALGAVRRSRASLGVSITGVAGPNEDEDGNPVGLIFCGVGRGDGVTQHLRLDLADKDPEANIRHASTAALRLLLRFSFDQDKSDQDKP